MEKARPASGSDRMLPPGVTAKASTWSARADQFPVFSGPWYTYRLYSYRVPVGVLALLLLILGLFATDGVDTLEGYIALGVVLLVIVMALALGRGLATLACRQGWTPGREAAAVTCAIAFGILATLAVTPYTRTSPPADRPTPPAHERAAEQRNRILNLGVWLVVLTWLGGAFDLALYFRQRRELREASLLQQVERYRDERNEVELQLAVLASQVEPHFLFNTLSGVRAAMLSDPARGIVLIDHLVEYLRSTIPQLRADGAHSFVALGSQLDSVAAYLGIIAARLPRLSFAVDCPTALRDAPIPPLMLISLVENAVKHGVELKRGRAHIQVAATLAGELLVLSVEDDGVGFGAATSGSGIGLANIRERLKHLYAGQATLSLQAGAKGGVIASITLPYGEN